MTNTKINFIITGLKDISTRLNSANSKESFFIQMRSMENLFKTHINSAHASGIITEQRYNELLEAKDAITNLVLHGSGSVNKDNVVKLISDLVKILKIDLKRIEEAKKAGFVK